MDDTDFSWDFEHFPFLPGIDLFLWLRLVLAAVLFVGLLSALVLT